MSLVTTGIWICHLSFKLRYVNMLLFLDQVGFPHLSSPTTAHHIALVMAISPLFGEQLFE